jgi:hypothetical protein
MERGPPLATESDKARIVGCTMTSNSRTQRPAIILWALAWALAIIASSILFKGSPAKDWIQSALFVGAVTVWLWQSRQVASNRC